jgi:hypothetical protein
MEHYVIRLWVPAPSAGDATDADPGMHGVVSHVATGRSQTFRDGRDLLQQLIDLRSSSAIEHDRADGAR